MLFQHRKDAGRQLAAKLAAYKNKRDSIVLALPRGGVPVGYEIACLLQLPFDVMLVRKLGVPGREELAMGAVAEGEVVVINESVTRMLAIPKTVIEQVIKQEEEEIARRSQLYHAERGAPELKGKQVILVDDGMATGANMRAAVNAVRTRQARQITVASPVISRSAYKMIQEVVDEVVCIGIPDLFGAVGEFYADFTQTTHEDALVLLGGKNRSVRSG